MRALPGSVSSLAFQNASPAGTGRVLKQAGLAIRTLRESIVEDAELMWVRLLPMFATLRGSSSSVPFLSGGLSKGGVDHSRERASTAIEVAPIVA